MARHNLLSQNKNIQPEQTREGTQCTLQDTLHDQGRSHCEAIMATARLNILKITYKCLTN